VACETLQVHAHADKVALDLHADPVLLKWKYEAGARACASSSHIKR
jgi:hypothetical protein